MSILDIDTDVHVVITHVSTPSCYRRRRSISRLITIHAFIGLAVLGCNSVAHSFSIRPSRRIVCLSTVVRRNDASTVLYSSTEQQSETASSPTAPIPSSTLPTLYPHFSKILSTNGFITPTPIQQSSSLRAKGEENLLLIAATGSGKTLAYLLPTLSRTRENVDGTNQRKTVLVVAPTRELAAQLARDASLLLPYEDETMSPTVLLAVRGIPPPTPSQIAHATVLVGTANELYAVLTRISGAQNFLAGDTLSGLVLDEVDVLLPPTPKTLRTSFDTSDGGRGSKDAQRERKALEQRRKLRAAQRRGVEFHGGSNIKGKAIDLTNEMNSQMITPTERVLKLVASSRFVGNEEDKMPLQVLAGSATASRTTLDRLNKALRWAASEGGVVGVGEMMDGVWKGGVKVCRPEEGDIAAYSGGDGGEGANETSHTIRAVTVPSVVDHRYVYMTKDTITNPQEILANIAQVTKKMQPETSLVFICGEFSRSISKEKKKEAHKQTAKTAQSRRDAKRRRLFNEKQKDSGSNSGSSGLPDPLSVRNACSILQSMGVDAKPMHVALGLEPNAEDGDEIEEVNDDENEVELPPVLVTFEGSARGLHFDGVDVVFVVGRPTSAASYLHLAGRVGRAMSSNISGEGDTGKVDVRPGTIVSFCSKGRVGELEKWTSQIGGTTLEEIEL